MLDSEDAVKNAQPSEELLLKLDGLLLHLTARAEEYDCVTRSFAPKLKVWEDPVCGSGHCHVIPLWANKLGKNELTAYQASRRTGVLCCHQFPTRLTLSGQAALYAKSEIFVPVD